MKIIDIISEAKNKNCGCGKDPCETYGTQREAYDPKYGHDTFSHVVKHKDDNGQAFWAVYNMNGKIVKVFYSEKSASKYAEKNHDALMKNKIKADEGLSERYGMRQGGAQSRDAQDDAMNMNKRANNRAIDQNREQMIKAASAQRLANKRAIKIPPGLPNRVLNPQQPQAPTTGQS